MSERNENTNRYVPPPADLLTDYGRTGQTDIIGLNEIIRTEDFISARSPLAFAVGKNDRGETVLCDFERAPQIIVAGRTGSGCAMFLDCLVVSIIYKAAPSDVRFMLIDSDKGYFKKYEGMPHLSDSGLIRDRTVAVASLEFALTEADRRVELFSACGASCIDDYNERVRKGEVRGEKLTKTIVVIAELSEFMLGEKRVRVEKAVAGLASKGRSVGMYLAIATAMPTNTVLSMRIASSIPSRIAFCTSTAAESQTILHTAGAERLGNDEMLFYPAYAAAPEKTKRVYADALDILNVIVYLQTHSDRSGSSARDIKHMPEMSCDPLAVEALQAAMHHGYISASTVQRRFSVGYARAMRILDGLEARGFIAKDAASSKYSVTAVGEAYVHGSADGIDVKPSFSTSEPELKELFVRALATAVEAGEISVPDMQHDLGIGYVQAKKILDIMSAEGCLGDERADSPVRSVKITANDAADKYGARFGQGDGT